MPPAARVTDMHTCPMTTGPVPHVGGPILPPGVPTVLIAYLPAAHVTSMATCVGPPDAIVKGSTGVLIGNLPAARIGDLTTHGGVIIMGAPTVIIGEIGSPSPGAGGMGGIVAGLVTSLGIDRALNSIYSVGDAAAKKLAEVAARHLAGKKGLKKWVAGRPSTGIQKPFDGKVIGAGCTPSDSNTAATAKGMRPAKCADPSKTIPKVYFANGLNTKAYGDGASMCGTMQKIADQTCAEVVGIYGAAEGMIPDVNQAVDEIRRTSSSGQAKTLEALISDSAESDPPSDVNLIVHSRGGLAAQQAIADAKASMMLNAPRAEVEQALSHINVTSLGTAEQGWPVGPEYSKLNNNADPIPGIIKGAQDAFPKDNPVDNDLTPTVHINEPQLSPIAAHSLDNIYIKHLPTAAGARDCSCS